MAKSRRSKPDNLVHVKDLKAVDAVLAEIAGIKRGLDRIDLDLAEGIDDLRARAAAEAEPLKQRLSALENGLLAFAEYNRPELFRTKKSVDLVFGSIGFRKSTRISLKRTTLEKLMELGFDEAVRVKRSVDREVLLTWPDERLELVEARRVVQDKFWYETRVEDVGETA